MTETVPTTIGFENPMDGSKVQIFLCRKAWEQLQMTGQDGVRYCDNCRKSVRRVVDAAGFQSAVADAKCVMVAGYSEASDEAKHFVGQPSGSGYQVTDTKLVWGS